MPLRLSVLILSASLTAAVAHPGRDGDVSPGGRARPAGEGFGEVLPIGDTVRPDHSSRLGARNSGDTLQAGDPAFDGTRLAPFSLGRTLTLTRGDSAMPFGRQSERLTRTTLAGQPALLHVLTFETPRATTVDSSWLAADDLRPLRVRSTNAQRIVSLEFDGARVRGTTTPTQGAPTSLDAQLGARAFEWNSFGLALSALPLRPGYRSTVPVYTDRLGRVVWYKLEVRDTSLVRPSGYRSPMWEVVATGDSAAPSARFWISRHHRFVDQVLVWEPGVSILYARALEDLRH